MSETSCPRLGFERILLATDHSSCSAAAVEEAINIAKVCGGMLYSMSVVEVNEEYDALAPQIVEKSENEVREHLEGIKELAGKEGVKCETIAHRGDDPYRMIIDEAARLKADMIIMGSHGRTGLKRLMMGSVTSRVIGHAKCKVMVVPCP